VGAGSLVGAGAVVPEGFEVPPGSLVLGVPARVVRPLSEAETERIRANARQYVEYARRYRTGELG
jgi:carbonic anhydrase/acetyltransferase-like protein (isoleucine patch superfamily)